MARQVLPIVGAVIGAYFGGPQGAQIGFAIGSVVGNAVDPQHIAGPRLEEFPAMGTSEGTYRAVVYGTCVVRNCQLIDWGDIQDITVEEQQGKGGGPVVETQRLLQTYAIGIGEGPITGIRYIKRDGKMVYDVRPGSTIMAESAKWAQRMRVYLGTDDQLPDPDLEAFPLNGVGNTPAYRGTAYFVMVNDDLTDFGGRIPTYEVEVTRAGVADAVETVAMTDYDNGAEGGGVEANWIRVNQAYVDLRAFNAIVAGLGTGTDQPVYIRVLAPEAAGGAVLWDSGWIGDPADQSALTAALSTVTNIRFSDPAGGIGFTDVTDPAEIGVFRTNLNGAIQSLADVSGYFVPPYGIGENAIVQVIRPWNAGMDTVSGEWVLSEPDPAEVTEPYVHVPEVPGAIVGLTTGTTWFTPYATGVGAVNEASIALSGIVEDVCDRCGLDSASLDFSALDADAVLGVTLGGPYNGAGSITTMMPAFFFDLAQPEKILKAVKRGGAVAQTITADSLVDAPDENILRGQDIEYPRALLLKYLDAEQDYAAPAAVVSRTSPDIRVRGEAAVELPISLSRTEAFRAADRMLKVMWEDLNGEVTFSLPAGPFAWLAPTDVLALSLRGAVYRLRVERIEGDGSVLKITARRDRQSAYTSNLTPIPLPAPEGPPSSLAGPTILKVMNGPGLVDGDDRLGVRIALGAVLDGWSGAQVQYSADDGETWITLGTYTTRAVMGVLLSDLPYASAKVSDWANSVHVQLFDDRDLDSATLSQLLRDANPIAVIRPDDTVEVIQYQAATDLGSNAWSLGNRLLRGRLGTTPAAHDAGAYFVTLESTIFVELPTSRIGQDLLFRATSIGTSPETATEVAFTWNPVVGQTELAPTQLTVNRDGTNVVASWSPRHRFGTEINPVASANFTGWRVTLDDGTATRFTTADPEFTVADTFGASLDVSVAAVNRLTGEGATASVTGLT
jgi:hypothetical protein